MTAARPSRKKEIKHADLIDVVDELHVIRAAATAAVLVYHSRGFTPNSKSHFSALDELLNSIEEKIEALYEQLNDELDARRRHGGGVN